MLTMRANSWRTTELFSRLSSVKLYISMFKTIKSRCCLTSIDQTEFYKTRYLINLKIHVYKGYE